ncbi:hypothetical protein V8G54_005439 [Vigna mungo]|uniref:Uncharacterized protein n=1 Tax=Vigna mungo TaxID=3915 RepID=A0AAQ3P040_VIGMU
MLLIMPSKTCPSITLYTPTTPKIILSCSLLCKNEASKPQSSIALTISSLLITPGSYSTSPDEVAKATTALLTPGRFLKIPSTEFTHAAHVIPPIVNCPTKVPCGIFPTVLDSGNMSASNPASSIAFLMSSSWNMTGLNT